VLSPSSSLPIAAGPSNAGKWVRLDPLVFLVGTLAWRALLDFAYLDLLFPLNEYFGFRNAPSLPGTLESYVLTAVGALMLPTRGRLPSTYLLHLFFVLGIVPILSYYALASEPRWMLYTLLSAYAMLVLGVRVLPPLVLPPLAGHGRLALLLMVGLVLVAVGSLAVKVGAGGLNFDLAKVYEFRAEVSDAAYSGLWAYLYSWVGGTICVALMAYFAATGRFGLAVLALLAQVFMFAATSHKVYLFQPVIVIGTYWLLARTPWRSVLVWGLFAAVLGAVALFAFFELDFVGDLIVRRTLYVPAFLDFAYLDFFSSHDKVFLTNSLFSWLSDYPYGDRATGLVIGNYIGFPDVNAVTGYLGTAYMNFGVGGLFLYSILIAALLRFLDGCVAYGLPGVFVAASAVAPLRAVFTESDLFTTLLTHGLGILLVLLSMMGEKPKPSSQHPRSEAAGDAID